MKWALWNFRRTMKTEKGNGKRTWCLSTSEVRKALCFGFFQKSWDQQTLWRSSRKAGLIYFFSRREEQGTCFQPSTQKLKKIKKKTTAKTLVICGISSYLLTLYLHSCVLYLGEELTHPIFPSFIWITWDISVHFIKHFSVILLANHNYRCKSLYSTLFFPRLDFRHTPD